MTENEMEFYKLLVKFKKEKDNKNKQASLEIIKKIILINEPVYFLLLNVI